ncbi:MAG TPA: septum formation initiator family protein [Clostridia bacterium]|nr:septum formation initiator family protein [Clostridia bacterium]
MRQSYVENRKRERIRSSRMFFLRFFVGIAAVLILAMCLSSFLGQQNEFERLTAERRKLERERDLLFQKYESLKGLNEIADSDEYIERMARDYLGMAKPGDILIITD